VKTAACAPLAPACGFGTAYRTVAVPRLTPQGIPLLSSRGVGWRLPLPLNADSTEILL